jgi:hypothetical protein
LRDNNNATIIAAPRRRDSHPDCRRLPILIAALQKGQRIAERVDQRMDLGAQSAAATPDGLIVIFF